MSSTVGRTLRKRRNADAEPSTIQPTAAIIPSGSGSVEDNIVSRSGTWAVDTLGASNAQAVGTPGTPVRRSCRKRKNAEAEPVTTTPTAAIMPSGSGSLVQIPVDVIEDIDNGGSTAAVVEPEAPNVLAVGTAAGSTEASADELQKQIEVSAER